MSSAQSNFKTSESHPTFSKKISLKWILKEEEEGFLYVVNISNSNFSFCLEYFVVSC